MDFTKISRFVSEHKLATIIVVGIIVRLVLIPISSHPLDVYFWYSTSLGIIQNGPLAPPTLFPTLWSHYMMIPIAYSYDWLARFLPSGVIPMGSLPSPLNFYPSNDVQFVPGMLFNCVLKFPLLVSDVLIALLLFKTVDRLTSNRKFAEKAVFLWFLNPFVIWISSGWGMWDTLPALFSLAAFYLLLKKRIAFSAICLGLGVALKLYPVLFLLPIIVYVYKSHQFGERVKACVTFCSVFASTSILLFLPDISFYSIFADRFGILSPQIVTNAIANPVFEPLGYGLTYWSLYLLNRLINIPINSGFISSMIMLSLISVAVSLTLVYWKTTRFSFEKPAFDLITAMLFVLFALFLSYHVVCEQFFVWALPFLVILYSGGYVKGSFFWATSFVALVYSFLNCPLPFIFLPLSPWVQDSLLKMVYFVWWVEPLRIVFLATLGCMFSVILLLIIVRYHAHR